MSTRAKVFLGIGIWFALAIALGVLFGSDGRNDAFQPQEEFRLEPWISLEIAGIDMSINKAVMYLFFAAAATTGSMVYIARRMRDRPNRVQTAVEVAYAGNKGTNLPIRNGWQMDQLHPSQISPALRSITRSQGDARPCMRSASGSSG